MGELSEPLKPCGWKWCPVEVIGAKVEVFQRGEVEKRPAEAVTQPVVHAGQVERGDTAVSGVAADAVPGAAVRAGLPRSEVVTVECEVPPEPEESRGLAWEAWSWGGGLVAVCGRGEGRAENLCV